MNNLSFTNEPDLLDDPWYMDQKIDQYLGKVPPFSSLGVDKKNLLVRSSFKGITPEEVLIITRQDVEFVIRLYFKLLKIDNFHEDTFYHYALKKGFCKTRCFYFFNRLLTHGGYDGKLLQLK